MNRRLFASALAGLVATPRCRGRFYDQWPATEHSHTEVLLEAIAGPCLPKTLVAHGAGTSRFFELRVYDSSPLDGREIDIFRRAGVHPMLCGIGTYLIPFDSLEARGRAWDAVAADPEWMAAKASVSKIEIYRPVQPGGRILEMSL